MGMKLRNALMYSGLNMNINSVVGSSDEVNIFFVSRFIKFTFVGVWHIGGV